MTPPPDRRDSASELPAIAARVARRLLAGDGAGDRLGGVHVTPGPAPRLGAASVDAGAASRSGPAAGSSGPAAGSSGPAAGSSGPAAGRSRAVVTVECLARTADGAPHAVPAGALVTDLAREEAARRGIALVPAAAGVDGAGAGLRIALGADHGGFALKARLAAVLAEAGHRVHDLGTHDEHPVDYPDFAVAVAREVAAGRADVGICVDGAGIGSAMAAGKVPGVRAANCSTVALARNAREHNYANVLTLGGRLLDGDLALAIVRAFLSTPFGAERHGRRVAKIDALDARPATLA